MTIRALIIDDSLVVRHTVSHVLTATDDIDVVGTASDGRMGLRRIEQLQPDVVTLDVEMPGLNGLETMVEIRRSWPRLPVIMYSTLTERGAHVTIDALAAGAVDYATKPSGTTSRAESARLVRETLVPLVRLWGRRPVGRPAVRTPRTPVTLPEFRKPLSMICIGVSTGGPDTLATMLPQLSPRIAVPVTLVQHMPPLFTTMLAKRLDAICPLTVREAVDGEIAEAGTVYLAPGGRHLEVSRETGPQYVLRLTEEPPENSCRPAVDVLFRTAAEACDGGVLGVVLTGMGSDGERGSRAIRERGGTVYAQDEASSVVWGMPGSVCRAGHADAVLPLTDMAAAISTKALNQTPTGAPR